MIHDLLYSNIDVVPEINAIVNETDNEVLESEVIQIEQSPNPRKISKPINSVASLTVASMESGSSSSDFVSAAEAAQLQANGWALRHARFSSRGVGP